MPEEIPIPDPGTPRMRVLLDAHRGALIPEHYRAMALLLHEHSWRAENPGRFAVAAAMYCTLMGCCSAQILTGLYRAERLEQHMAASLN